MNPNGHILGVVNTLSKKLRRFCDQSLAEMGLTGTQGRVLCYIFLASQWQDVYQRNIEEIFEIRRSTATGILKLLERDGYINRISVVADARLKKIILTGKSAALQSMVVQEVDRIDALIRRGLSDEEIATYIHLTERICENLPVE